MHRDPAEAGNLKLPLQGALTPCDFDELAHAYAVARISR